MTRRNDGKPMKKVSMYMKEKVIATYVKLGNYTETAKVLGMEVKTVHDIVKRHKDEYHEMREQMKEQMIQELWGNLIDAQKLGHMYIKEALDKKRDIPLNHVSAYFGTMYDKQALLSGENTQNVGGGIQVVLNMPDVEDEDEWGSKEKQSD